jgi:hypothetical protein
MALRPPRLQIRPRNPHTDYPRLSRLKPNADGMKAIRDAEDLMATDDADHATIVT